MLNKQPFFVMSFLPFIEMRMEYINSKRKERDDNLDDKMFLKEFATIRLNFGRQTGNTELFKKILERHEDSIGLTYLYHLKKEFPEEMRNRVFIFEETYLPYINGKIVVVDVSYFLSESKLENIYCGNPKFLILLG